MPSCWPKQSKQTTLITRRDQLQEDPITVYVNSRIYPRRKYACGLAHGSCASALASASSVEALLAKGSVHACSAEAQAILQKV
eukprot:4758046-Amphidinium_carterae.1